MKKVIFPIIIIMHSLGVYAQMDLPPVGFNPRATISEEVGITSITIRYSRPGVKGREENIWGGIVGNGFGTFSFVTNSMTSPWRAGANEATVISFEHDVRVEGKSLKAGSYALFMAVEADSVALIFSSQTNAWGSFYYRPQNDVLRVKVKKIVLDRSVEWLKYEFTDHKENGCVIALQWEKLSVPFTIEVDVDNIVLARMREEFTGVKGFVSANRLQASMYWFNKNRNMEEALSWAQSAVTGRPFGQSGFDAYQNLAAGYEIMNRLQQSDSVMNEGLTIANINQHIGYGKSLIAKKRFDRALEIMLAAQKKFGDVFAVNNGLAYAYAAKADFTKALEFANKALHQAPPQAKVLWNGNIEKLKAKKDIN
ncbi:MAG: DUF2911 domain-containing protein [Chitinophagaceae bacterium]